MVETKVYLCGGCGCVVNPGIRFCSRFCKRNPKPKPAKSTKKRKNKKTK